MRQKGSGNLLSILVGVGIILIIGIFFLLHKKKLPSAKVVSHKKSISQGVGTMKKIVSSTEEVKKIAEESLQKNPNDKSALINLLGVALKDKDMAKAQEIAAKLLKLYPNDSKVLNNVGNLNFVLGKYKEAQKYWKKSLDADPKNTDVLYNLANLSFAKGDTDKALEYMDDYFTFASGDAAAYELMGNIYFAKGQMKKAYSYLKKSLDLYPDNQDALMTMAKVEINMGKLDEAQKHVNKLLSLSNDWRAYHLLGLIYVKKNNLALAYSTLDKGYQLIPEKIPPQMVSELADYLNDYGYLILQSYNVNRNSEYLKRAEWMFKRVLTLNPNALPAKLNLAIVSEDKKDYSTAMKIYQEILQVSPRNIRALINLGLLYMNVKKDYEKASSLFEKVLQLDSQNMPAHYNYGLSLYFSGRKDAAIREMETVKKYAAGTTLAQMATQVIQKIKSEK
jgi:tetratricopeptide (TPR) repeat protein